MACANRKPQPSSLVEDINTLNLFGKCQSKDLIFSDHEEKERERRFIQAERKRELELLRQEEKRRKEEIAFKDFLNEAKNKPQKSKEIPRYIPPMGRGRGSFLHRTAHNGVGEIKPRGRGRLSPQEKACLPLFEREQKVQKNLHQFSESILYNNAVQKKYWSNIASNKEEEEEEEEEEEDYDYYIPDNLTNSSSTSDQYEDAESFTTSSPQSFNSVPSCSSSDTMSDSFQGQESRVFDSLSPRQRQSRPEVTSSPRPQKLKGSRLAAKFTRPLEEQENEEKVNGGNPFNEITQNYALKEEAVGLQNDCDDPLSVLAPYAPPKYKNRHSVGTTFNSLNPSHRVLSNDVLKPEEVFSSVVNGNRGFTLNMKDFPSL